MCVYFENENINICQKVFKFCRISNPFRNIVYVQYFQFGSMLCVLLKKKFSENRERVILDGKIEKTKHNSFRFL